MLEKKERDKILVSVAVLLKDDDFLKYFDRIIDTIDEYTDDEPEIPARKSPGDEQIPNINHLYSPSGSYTEDDFIPDTLTVSENLKLQTLENRFNEFQAEVLNERREIGDWNNRKLTRIITLEETTQKNNELLFEIGGKVKALENKPDQPTPCLTCDAALHPLTGWVTKRLNGFEEELNEMEGKAHEHHEHAPIIFKEDTGTGIGELKPEKCLDCWVGVKGGLRVRNKKATNMDFSFDYCPDCGHKIEEPTDG